jgi:hypothetical protein
MHAFEFHHFSTHNSPLTEPASAEAEARWKPLYRMGALTALLTVVLTLLSIPVYLIWPLPGIQANTTTVLDYYTIFQDNWLRGLFDLDLIMVISAVLAVPFGLALFISLRRANPSWMVMALGLILMSSAAYLAVNPAFTMLTLSQTYAATAPMQQPLVVAAGQATLATYQGTGFDLYYICMALGFLIISVVMLRSAVFSKLTGFLGLIMSICMLIPPTVGMVGLVMSILSLLPMFFWDLLLARRLWQLSQPAVAIVAPNTGGTGRDSQLETPGNGHVKTGADASY